MRVRVETTPLRQTPPGARKARERLALPRGPIVMTGHQAEAWHAGIAAKFIAARAIADAVGGTAAWLTPDHVPTQPWRLKAPVIRRGRLAARTLDLADPNAAGAPVSTLAPAKAPRVDWKDAEPASDSIRRGAAAHAENLLRFAGAESAAAQITSVMEAALGGVAASGARLWASRLAARGALSEILDAIAADPVACVRAFNAAAQARPEAGVSELRITTNDVELPLWRISRGMRRRVFSSELLEADPTELAPRALLMTAVARLDLCDLFIHGTGGAAYDRVTEDWIARWLGEDARARLAPVAMVTADVFLPLDHLAADDAAIDAAAWRAHHARHDPALLGDEKASAQKNRLLREIQAAKQRDEDPAPHFRNLHALLDRVRAENAPRLRELDDEAARLAPLRGSRSVARDRTWPVFLHEQSVITELAERVAAEVLRGIRSPAPAPRG